MTDSRIAVAGAGAKRGHAYEVTNRRLLGVFYTPDDVAAALVRWAVRGGRGRLLEPSFGGCSFLRASVAELVRLGGSPADIVGIDIDEAGAAPAAEALIAEGLPRENIHYRDFLELKPVEVGRFSAIVGNPPFVRHHWQHTSWRRSARRAVEDAGIELSQRASTWAYFVVHATSFLEEDGRLAFVLPGAALHADYAEDVVSFLERKFTSVRLLRLRERLFDAQEEAVIALASGYGRGRTKVRVSDVAAIADVDRAVHVAAGENDRPISDIKLAVVPKLTRRVLETALGHPSAGLLGSLATIRIGVVTGANRFFVRPVAELPGVLGTRGVPIISRSSWLQAPLLTKPEFNAFEREGAPTRLLLIDRSWRRRGCLAAEIDEWETQGVDDRYHCRNRERWWVLTDFRAPDAFLPYMGAAPRGLVLNAARATCTNAIHRVDFNKGVDQTVVCASTWTSLFDLCAELYGRHYGGGVLKIEPTVAQRLPVIKSLKQRRELDAAYALFAAGDVPGARELVDNLFLVGELGMTDAEVVAVRSAATALRAWREEVKTKATAGSDVSLRTS